MATIKIKTKIKKNSYEIDHWSRMEIICGIDEVGRSCLAGPVVAAAVILNPNKKHKLLKDSKILTQLEREIAYKWLQKNSIYGIGIINHRIIDSHNIYQATLQAMKKAVYNLMSIALNSNKKPAIIIVDAMPLLIDYDIPIHHFPFGESRSISIAAASIIAKVTRDHLMERLDKVFPGYSLNTNKGYGSKFHKNSINSNGVTVIHRRRFVKNYFDKINLSNN